MAREKASINLEVWADTSFRDLTAPAQGLYFKLMSHPKLDYCGVVEFHPGRLAALSKEQTVDDVMLAASELSEAFWIVIDQDTDEVMVRGYLRHDGVLRQPRLAVSCALAYSAVASNKIRAVIVHEIQRFKRENPDLPAWEKPQMRTLLKQESVDVRDTVTELDWVPVTGAVAQAFGRSYDRPEGEGYGQRSDETLGDAMTGATTSTATSTPTATRSNDLSDDREPSSSQGSPGRVKGIRSGVVA